MSAGTETPRTTSAAGTGAVAASPRAGRAVEVAWAASGALVVMLLALVPLVRAPRYYFNDDTQIGAYGIWFRIGELLREGGFSFLETDTWAAGNYFVEGQWGLLNPVVLLIGLLASYAPDAVVFSTAVKAAVMGVAAVGAYGLVRDFGGHRHWALLAGIGFPLAGFTFYMDATTWVTGLFTSAGIPWFWWMARRAARGRNPVGMLVAGYLVVTVGYVHGTIALVFVICAVLVDAMIAGQRRGALVVLGASVLLGLVAVAVYLPGVLSADVTVRQGSSILNDGFLVADLNGLLASAISTARPEVSAWWGAFAVVPMLYISWALPLVAFVDVRKIARDARELVGIGLFLLVMVLWVVGPSYAGPLRIPVRMMPYVSLAALVLLAVVLSRALVARVTLARGAVFVALVLIGAYLAFVQVPGWGRPLAVAVAVLLVVGATYFVLLRTTAGRRALPLALVAVLATSANVVVQHRYQPDPPLADFGMPSAVAEYQRQLDGVEENVFVVGAPTQAPGPEVWEETLLANTWYLNPAPVQNVYTPVGFAAYSETLCVSNRGESCAGSLDALFAEVEGTSSPLVDLMGIGNVQLVLSAFPDGVPTPPAGWHVATTGHSTELWTRDVAVPGPGHVTYASDGVEVVEESVSDDVTTLRVTDVPESGGTIVLSRMAWPGYRVAGGELAAPTGDFLLTVELDGDSVGETVEVSFRPPGWTLELGGLVVALLGAVGLCAFQGFRSRRSTTPAGTEV
ncbi:hypothetical protein [Cellulosimicrobium sp. NPDC055967]|uniref:hypothetical protein n=1 Tax=Cellulosimicrobium sp. NPDC055967 TaxID=3345670 RepID=UPI0035E01A37